MHDRPQNKRKARRLPNLFCSMAVISAMSAVNLGLVTVHAEGFSFSKAEEAAKAEDAKQEADKQARVSALLQTPCRNKIKNQKIMVLIGETRNGYIYAAQTAFDPHFNAINSRLQALGLKTYTQAQIRAQIKQAEIDAYFKNDADAAISASKRLSAQYILRGLISTQAGYNYAVNVNQVNIGMNFTLTGANGQMISQANAENASYAGQNVSGMALTLINERADELVGQLYSEYCKKSGVR